MPYCICEMNINGRGIMKVTPDIAEVTLGVISENKSLKVAQEENSVAATNVIQNLIKQGILAKDIQTLNYNIQEQYDNVEGKQIFRNYRVNNTFKVVVRAIKSLGEIIDSAVENGANSVNGISFGLSTPDKYYNLALKKAIYQAVNKAEAITNASRIILNRTPIKVIEQGTNYLPIYEAMALKAAATPVSPGEIQVTAEIKALFQYSQY